MTQHHTLEMVHVILHVLSKDSPRVAKLSLGVMMAYALNTEGLITQ